MKPHVAFLPSSGMGHIIPLLELAKRLVLHHAFKVTFFVLTIEPSPAQNHLLHSAALPSDLQVVDLPIADVSAVVTDDMSFVTRVNLIARESIRKLQSVLELNRPKALVIDIFSTDAIEGCRELSIPTYSFFTASTALLAFSLYLPTLDREVEGEFVDLPEPVHIPGCNSIRTEDLVEQVRDRKNDFYKWFLLHVSRLPLAAGIFVNTWDALEPAWLRGLKQDPFFQNMPTPPVYPIGPLIKQDEPVSGSDTKILTWLDNQPSDSVLFVALGSGGILTSEQLTELAWGLEMSQQRFILVVRKPSNASVLEAILNVATDADDPAAYLPEGFAERTEGVGLVVPSWAPQVAVLRHPSTGGFLSHCGWNSSLEAIVHGVPIVAWPMYAEQRMNATMLAEEVGVAVKPTGVAGERVVGREEIERVVRLVIEGEEGKVMRRRARELQDSGGKALKYGGSSYQSISRIADSWK